MAHFFRTPRRNRLAAGATAVAAVAGLIAGVPGSASGQQASASPALQASLDKLVRDNGFPGALATVSRGGVPVAFATAGTGDTRTGTPVPPDGQVRIASASKMFTATVVLQLAGEGKVKLDEPVETYLPGLVRGKDFDGNGITVHQLLQHTSGLPNYTEFTQDFLNIQHRYYEPRQLLDMAFAKPASFKPGAKWEYSNTNYILAGLLVQAVTGRPISEEVTNRIIRPAGLGHTYWPGVGDQTIREDHPHGYYTTADGKKADVTEMDPSWGWAAGQLIARPSDLNKFLTALLGGKLLKPEQLQQMKSTVDSADLPPTWHYGLGLIRIQLSCGDAWGHGGDIDGYETRDAVMSDGRSATVAVTALPGDLAAVDAVNAALDTALCAK
ncbi:serine hydrolase domain-containing protein [Amycolatopsis jejuensis]|uniref:serine hydrolase domain-containing protein n=1 Tax=Amycolatopsis jejuensis TaxID=330084 RepID=UPI00068F5241|nr:serine hydrolase domain-containing protein [Amycolatopsis jejuensis]